MNTFAVFHSYKMFSLFSFSFSVSQRRRRRMRTYFRSHPTTLARSKQFLLFVLFSLPPRVERFSVYLTTLHNRTRFRGPRWHLLTRNSSVLCSKISFVLQYPVSECESAARGFFVQMREVGSKLWSSLNLPRRHRALTNVVKCSKKTIRHHQTRNFVRCIKVQLYSSKCELPQFEVAFFVCEKLRKALKFYVEHVQKRKKSEKVFHLHFLAPPFLVEVAKQFANFKKYHIE